MDTPRVALRFREITPNIDTVSEHRKIMERKATVWWGWWRKEFEPDHRNLFGELAAQGSGYVLLVDAQTERTFKAHFVNTVPSGDLVDIDRIPPYYRDQKPNVSGWFLLDEIQQIEFRSDISLRLGQSTLLILDGSEERVEETSREFERTVIKQPGILHLSDLHFGTDYAFLDPGQTATIGNPRRSLTECLMEDLRRASLLQDVGLLLITGDFTTQGDWSDQTRNQILQELASLRNALGLSKDCVVAIPGNHDIVRYKEGEEVDVDAFASEKQTTYRHEREYRTFLEDLTGRRWREPLQYQRRFQLGEIELVVVALNSCTITSTKWTEYGYVGKLGVSVMKTVGEMVLDRPTFKLMALHHHLIPVSRIEAPNEQGISLTLDAVELLDAAQRAGFHFVLHGHQHLARVARYARIPRDNESEESHGEIYIISGGSSGAGRLPGSERNAYSFLLPGQDGTRLVMRELRSDTRAGDVLYDTVLDAQPTFP